jgi:hypothetical protein
VDAVETRYVRSDTGWIAYQVLGSGPVVRPVLFPIATKVDGEDGAAALVSAVESVV